MKFLMLDDDDFKRKEMERQKNEVIAPLPPQNKLCYTVDLKTKMQSPLSSRHRMSDVEGENEKAFLVSTLILNYATEIFP